MKAEDFLRKSADLLTERGKQYDQLGGERSMGKAVRAFNAVTGRDLTEPEGWLLLQLLKDVRQWQNPDKYHADSAEDCVSYAALKAEALSLHMECIPEPGVAFVGSIFGNSGKPDWKDAPEWANWLSGDREGWAWCSLEPELESDKDEPDPNLKDWCALSVGKFQFVSYEVVIPQHKEPRP